MALGLALALQLCVQVANHVSGQEAASCKLAQVVVLAPADLVQAVRHCRTWSFVQERVAERFHHLLALLVGCARVSVDRRPRLRRLAASFICFNVENSSVCCSAGDSVVNGDCAVDFVRPRPCAAAAQANVLVPPHLDFAGTVPLHFDAGAHHCDWNHAVSCFPNQRAVIHRVRERHDNIIINSDVAVF